MSESEVGMERNDNQQWYERDIAVRGCQLTLPKIKLLYRELQEVSDKEGERIISSLVKPKKMSASEFEKQNKNLMENAFRITVSIIGYDGQTVYGEFENIFDSDNLPEQIKTIFMTNTTAYKRNADGISPRNSVSIGLHFDKPPLFDPNPLVSEPTPNSSFAEIKSEHVGFLRAMQEIVSSKLGSKKWYAFIHEKFSYDLGLWFVALPYALYWITIYADFLFPPGGKFSSFRIAFYIYGLGLSLILYRGIYGYLKWAFPVNILEENKDRATLHRLTLVAIVSGLFISGAKSFMKTLIGF